jgi:hypothetical protein
MLEYEGISKYSNNFSPFYSFSINNYFKSPICLEIIKLSLKDAKKRGDKTTSLSNEDILPKFTTKNIEFNQKLYIKKILDSSDKVEIIQIKSLKDNFDLNIFDPKFNEEKILIQTPNDFSKIDEIDEDFANTIDPFILQNISIFINNWKELANIDEI